VPDKPSFPNKRLLMLLAFCGSSFAGVALAYSLQASDRTFHTDGDVRELHMPVLEIIPAVRQPSRGTSPIDVVTRQTTSSFQRGFAQSLRESVGGEGAAEGRAVHVLGA
jgi:hypothetical protein